MNNQLFAQLNANELAAYLDELEEEAARAEAARDRELEAWLEKVEMDYAYREFMHGFAPVEAF